MIAPAVSDVASGVVTAAPSVCAERRNEAASETTRSTFDLRSILRSESVTLEESWADFNHRDQLSAAVITQPITREVTPQPESQPDPEPGNCNESADDARPKRPTVADLLRRYAPGFLKKHRQSLPDHVVKTLETLAACRTRRMGGHKWRCASCAHVHYSYNSCHHRSCPTCGSRPRAAWLERMRSWVLPVRYYHAVFTLDHRLSALIEANQRELYDLLFDSVKRALIDMAKDPEEGLGALIGMLMVLHSWGQALLLHAHIHVVIPAGGVCDDGTWMTIASDTFFLDEAKLADRYRDIFCKALLRQYRAGKLTMPQPLAHLTQSEKAFRAWLLPISSVRWHIHTCEPEHVHRPGAALEYLSRYVVGSMISDARIISDEDGQVTFWMKDYKNGGTRTTVTISGEEFVERFAMHLLPPRFMRVRYAGWLGSPKRKTTLAMAREALNVITPKEKETLSEDAVERELMEELAALDLADTQFRCPNCGAMALRWEGEFYGIMGWQMFRSQIPPIVRLRRELAAAVDEPGAETIRPPPLAPTS